jgi:hypothetical protein
LASRWLENISVVSNDLFMGRQFTRPKYTPEKPPEPLQAAVVIAPAIVAEK